jgi:phosphoserine phosphatase
MLFSQAADILEDIYRYIDGRAEHDLEGWEAAGMITGEIRGTPSFREGKVTRVAHWLEQTGLGWGDVEMTFYSDSMNDLPLLEKAHHPVATNPDARLRQLATERGWRILELFQE